jgi:hypothetical protein
MTETECSFRCGYSSSGRNLLEHEMHEHARCPECGREPIGVHSVSHKPDCPRLRPGYAYPELPAAGPSCGDSPGGRSQEGVSLASCGHPRNEDGECNCAWWPERAPADAG